jgi:dihydroorotate dehydrogenase (fumarate)
MDLKTTYMGMELKHPLVPSASPLSQSLEGIKALEDAGASAVVMFSLFEEQIRHEASMLEAYGDIDTGYAEATSFFPSLEDYSVGPQEYLDLISKAAEAVDVPVIASLNGITDEGWVDYAKNMQDAGAKGIELNVYYIAADPALSGAQVEQRYLDVLKAVKSAVTVPVAIKLSPFFSSMAHMAGQLEAGGADALVLFNRFYQPDFDLQLMEVETKLDLSTPVEIRLPLRWLAILSGQVKTSLAATTGVQSADEVVKYLLAGADVVMTTSALLKHKSGYLGTLLKDLTTWMERKEYASLEQMKGSMSQESVGEPGAFERANYIKILEKYKAEYSY